MPEQPSCAYFTTTTTTPPYDWGQLFDGDPPGVTKATPPGNKLDENVTCVLNRL